MTKFNILYFAFVSDHFGGVEQKIIGQFDALKKINEFSHLYLVATNQPNETFINEIVKRSDIYLLINEEKKNPLKRRAEKFNMINRAIQKFDANDSVIYFRFPGADFYFYKFLKNNSTYRIVTEHQEIENKLRIGKFTGSYLSDMLDFIFGYKTRKLIHGFVGVSSQYLDNQISYLHNFERNKKAILVNGNGIDVSKFKLRQQAVFDGKLIKILFVGGLYKSHGMHRLIEGLIKYDQYLNDNQLKVEVHIAGVARDESYLLKYETRTFEGHTVFYHGFLSRIELDILMDNCHMAVNSLSLHRIGLSITSTLKSREYFARGIPFITASEDNDFSSDNFFIHRIVADESPVFIPGLFEFMEKLIKSKDFIFEMRDYADSVLDWRHKMKKLNAFLANLLK